LRTFIYERSEILKSQENRRGTTVSKLAASRRQLTQRSRADSLDTVELVMALEEEFDIEIPDEAARTNYNSSTNCGLYQ